MTRKSTRVLCFMLSLCALLVYAPAYAQSDPINSDAISGYGLRNLANAVIINASPTSPSAGDTVHLTVEGSVYDLPKDSITWTINGKRVATGVGVTSFDATVDSRGSPLDISVSVTDSVWGIASAALTLTPIQLDLLYDAPTYVPPFYRGRALPSAGGTLHVEALARFSQSGKVVPSSSITYTWSRNGTVLGSISGLGKSKVSIDATPMYGADTISVRASANETLSASASAVIPSAAPVTVLYEDHPLYGITYFSALASPISTPSEMTVAAIPYFATVTSLNDPTLQFDWLVNDTKLAASSTKRNELTINNDHASADLHLDVTSARNIFLSSASDWKFIFGNTGAGAGSKPGATDAFHNSQL